MDIKRGAEVTVILQNSLTEQPVLSLHMAPWNQRVVFAIS